jgi:hypothetical protein
MTGEQVDTYGGQTFGDISNEMQWEWDTEIEVLRGFVRDRGLESAMVMYARDFADDELGERIADGEYKDWANQADWPDDIATLTLTPNQFRQAMKGAVLQALEHGRPAS